MVGTDDAVSPTRPRVDRADEREMGRGCRRLRIIEEEQLARTRLEVAHGRDGVGQPPRCTGICAACAIISPSASNSAAERRALADVR